MVKLEDRPYGKILMAIDKLALVITDDHRYTNGYHQWSLFLLMMITQWEMVPQIDVNLT